MQAMTKVWYAQGLRFSCTGCGHCCTGEAGFTWVTDAEIAALARHLGLEDAVFRRRYTEVVHRDGTILISLVEQRGGDCTFFRPGQGCTVYALRPRQCRTWPFWRRIIASPSAWKDEALTCPGMNHGELHQAKDLAATAADDGLP